MKFTLEQLIGLRRLLQEKEIEHEKKQRALKNNKNLTNEEYSKKLSALYSDYHIYWELLDKLNTEEF